MCVISQSVQEHLEMFKQKVTEMVKKKKDRW